MLPAHSPPPIWGYSHRFSHTPPTGFAKRDKGPPSKKRDSNVAAPAQGFLGDLPPQNTGVTPSIYLLCKERRENESFCSNRRLRLLSTPCIVASRLYYKSESTTVWTRAAGRKKCAQQPFKNISLVCWVQYKYKNQAKNMD